MRAAAAAGTPCWAACGTLASCPSSPRCRCRRCHCSDRNLGPSSAALTRAQTREGMEGRRKGRVMPCDVVTVKAVTRRGQIWVRRKLHSATRNHDASSDADLSRHPQSSIDDFLNFTNMDLYNKNYFRLKTPETFVNEYTTAKLHEPPSMVKTRFQRPTL